MSRTRSAVAVLGTLVLLALVAVTQIGARRADQASLEQRVHDFTRQLTPRGPYRPPDPAERDAVLGAIAALVPTGPAAGGDTRDAHRVLRDAGFIVEVAQDAAGRGFLLVRSDPSSARSWGLIALPLGRAPRLLVEVPHPNSDYNTENVGLAVLAIVPDAVYIEAGAHRRAADGRADVAHAEDSLFHALAVDLSVRMGLPQLQLHGFGERDDLDDDVVLGPGDAHPAVRELTDALEEAGLSVCRSWVQRCPELEGSTNVQGRAAARYGLPFAHVEMSASTRMQPESVARALATLAG
ncbi:hypothetical protein ACQPWY_15320 [Pseudonocardia xinjiangensis]|uniref:hypothetical protein n=1 Tax=Pseudonocardia xinjiangensis TaxID=75289 RepID=UPI003D8F4D5D